MTTGSSHGLTRTSPSPTNRLSVPKIQDTQNNACCVANVELCHTHACLLASHDSAPTVSAFWPRYRDCRVGPTAVATPLSTRSTSPPIPAVVRSRAMTHPPMSQVMPANGVLVPSPVLPSPQRRAPTSVLDLAKASPAASSSCSVSSATATGGKERAQLARLPKGSVTSCRRSTRRSACSVVLHTSAAAWRGGINPRQQQTKSRSAKKTCLLPTCFWRWRRDQEEELWWWPPALLSPSPSSFPLILCVVTVAPADAPCTSSALHLLLLPRAN